MPQESEHFRCSVCGQHGPIERLTEEGPFELAMFKKTLGGKHKLTEVDHIERRRKESYRGAAPGVLKYDEIPVTDELRELFKKRLGEVKLGGEVAELEEPIPPKKPKPRKKRGG